MAALAGHCTSQVSVVAPSKITRRFLVFRALELAPCLQDGLDLVDFLTEPARFGALHARSCDGSAGRD